MKDRDNLQKFIFENAPVRGELVHLYESYQAIIAQHDYPDMIRNLLGEALVVACLLRSIIKYKGRLTVQFNGKGKLKLLMAQCTHDFHIRGLAQYEDINEEQDLIDALSQGTLAIMMDPDLQGAKRYQGIVAWKRGESLAQSIEEYFRLSEQLPTRIWLAVNQHSVSGMLLQVMPKEKPELYQDTWEHLLHLSDTIQSNELLTLDTVTILHRLYSEEDIRIFQPQSVIFQCTCSVKRSENAILLLGQQEAESELKTNHKLIVTCEFCNKEYIFDRIDVARIFKLSDESKNLH